MTSTNDGLSKKLDRVKKSIEQFPAAAASLNVATTQLGQSIVKLDAILKKFSIGIPTWVSFSGSANSVPSYYHEDLGYAKIAGRWGIAVRTVSGDVRSEESDKVEQWLLPDAPRFLAVQAIEKVPELLEEILKGAAEMSKRIAERAEEVDLLTAGISSVADPPAKPKVAQQRGSAPPLTRAEEIQNTASSATAILSDPGYMAMIEEHIRANAVSPILDAASMATITNALSSASDATKPDTASVAQAGDAFAVAANAKTRK